VKLPESIRRLTSCVFSFQIYTSSHHSRDTRAVVRNFPRTVQFSFFLIRLFPHPIFSLASSLFLLFTFLLFFFFSKSS